MRRLLVKGATVISMDPLVGDLRPGDILIEGGQIAAVGAGIIPDNAEIFDAASFIVIPGLVNAHMHTWQTGLRAVSANWTLLEYFRWMHAGLATRFRPEDIRIGNLVGALAAGLLLGVSEAFTAFFWASEWAGALSIMLLLVILVTFPRGFVSSRQ